MYGNYIILLHIYMCACLNVAYLIVFMFKCLHNVILTIVTSFFAGRCRKGKKSSRGYVVPWDDDMDKVLLDTLVEY